MSINKIIFLDIDGVLNHRGTVERHGPFLGIDQKLVKIFNKIIRKTGAKVVLSSTWRLSEDWLETMTDNGLKCMFLGRTPHMGGEYRGNNRGLEIAKWLSEYHENVKFCIIDDDNDMLPDQKFFQTNFDIGLTEEIANEIINYLGVK